MSNPSFSWTTVLVTGGGGGLGRALAAYFLKNNKKVIIAGRTESKLQSTARELGCEYLVVDVGAVEGLQRFTEEAIKKFPDLDAVVANAGIQRKPVNFTTQDAASLLQSADDEINVNIRGTLHLIHHLLPHLLSKPNAAIYTVSSGLAFIPIGRIPVYCATKAFVHSWTQSLRVQLKGRVQVMEIIPPLVESDLHRDHDDPDNNKKHKNPMALTIDEFIAGVDRDIQAGKDEITPGFAQDLAQQSLEAFGEKFRAFNQAH
ncbi:uncharacterized protein SPPG_06167 [Spizellomyces punctatus DAOM BR117]|uniref:Ketoreductase domain-containing protein n=1 Tax=Spizellomyces punctatus (strain DAOM BR117) TaxID=645134 RepID=A0A0L0HC01_SPIPD|nr:uncharacterized protein SPPG_06167 [Spizellomyces punctatus DAOM BR117]KNC98466.1 hypothetical protein SPPG_06167 [Spizellomyces punctatus DAOM BR117]|eukprot:XP_016606506.1 hypothetical protein SPPG_06167 [Spizellomyces punctatus DAOM BR117]